MKLSKHQSAILKQSLDGRIFYYYYHDATMNALARRGLAVWHSRVGVKYGKSHWYVTDKGIERAKQENGK